MCLYAYDVRHTRMTLSPTRTCSAASGIVAHSTGKERDAESGNDYMFARYYNSATGRFLSPDWSAKIMPVPYAKLDDPQSLNLYAYLMNNPLAGVDADGHCGADTPQCKSLGANNPATQVSTQQRAAINANAAASNNKTPDDKKGGNHETGLESYKDSNGQQVNAPSKPGAVGTLSGTGGQNSIHVDPSVAANPNQQMPAGTVPDIQAHAHPAGTVTTEPSPLSTSPTLGGSMGGTTPIQIGFWNGPPSPADISGAYPAPTLNIVVAPGTVQNPSGQPTVYFFTPQGCTCQMPEKDFK
jgi:RHS repeat-associated protein